MFLKKSPSHKKKYFYPVKTLECQVPVPAKVPDARMPKPPMAPGRGTGQDSNSPSHKKKIYPGKTIGCQVPVPDKVPDARMPNLPAHDTGALLVSSMVGAGAGASKLLL